MPTVRINGVDIEVPRHVHRVDGTSKIVWTEDECVAALDDGWSAVPPSASTPPVETQASAPEPIPLVESTPVVPEPPELAVDVVEVIADAVRTEEILPPVEPVAPPVSRPRGRPRAAVVPRKVQP